MTAAALAERGAHLVLCRGKRPLGKWRERPAPPDAVEGHTGTLGLIPASIGMSALDIDAGDWQTLPGPALAIPSRRPGGMHLYYRDTLPRGNGDFSYGGASGQIRSGAGYLILWDAAAPELLLDALEGRRSLAEFPPALLPLRRGKRPRKAPEPVSGAGRNDALYAAVREWAASAPLPVSLEDWHREVRARAREVNAGFREPLPAGEVKTLAYYRAERAWAFRRVQALRGRLGGLRRAALRRKETAERDASIRSARARGASLRALARQFQLSVGGIRQILRRAA